MGVWTARRMPAVMKKCGRAGGAAVGVALLLGASLGPLMISDSAWAEEAGPAKLKVKPGMLCTVADGWWSLDRQRPIQPEPVRVVKLQALASAEPGAWIKPLRGPMTDYEYLIAQQRLSDCKE